MSMPVRGAATIVDVARRAGVSKSTASRALSGAGHVSPDAVQRVVRAAQQLSYVANPAARALVTSSGTRVVIAVVAPKPDVAVDHYITRALAAAASVCAPERIGVGLELVTPGHFESVAAWARDSTVQGVVLINTTEQLLAAIDRQLPGRVVSIGVGSRLVPSVDVDNSGAAFSSLRHLVRSGRRRIAIVTGPVWMPCTHRSIRAYHDVMREAGLKPRVVQGDFTSESGRAAAATVLRRWPDIDAIFAMCDASALGVLAELRARGISSPGDVAVAGFDDIPFAAFAGLTTATHPVEMIASAATRTVLEARLHRPDDLMFGSELVLRESA
jgi:DNA-binding LacI/PurR family transcriptional regulator